ncbi:Ribonuclease P protein subunit p40 [Chamberlinius hualienensis]
MVYKIGGKLARQEFFLAGNFKQNLDNLENVIEGSHFVHQMEITLPYSSHVVDVSPAHTDCEYYFVKEAPLTLFLDADFIGAFVKTGKIYFLSWGTRIDVDDCVALLPSGKLVLSLTKDTFEELGLEGRKSRFEPKKSRKFVIEIDLLAKSFYPGKPNFDRMLHKFEERVGLTFDFLCTWDPHDDEISRRSLLSYLKSKNYKIEVCNNQIMKQLTLESPTPQISWDIKNDIDKVGYKEFFEWLGAITCEIDLGTIQDPYISTFICPQPSDIVGHISRVRLTGFLTPNSVHSILKKIRDTKFPESIPWIALTVSGFDDVPVLDNQDHGVALTNGDNFYTIVCFFNDNNYWLYKYTSFYTYDKISKVFLSILANKI